MVKRIPLEQLKPGMFICSFDLSWFKHPFVSTRLGVVRDQGLINELKRLGVTQVDVDTSLGVPSGQPSPAVVTLTPSPTAAPVYTREPPPPCPPPTDPERTARFAKKLFDQAMGVTRSVLDGLTRGEPVNLELMQPLLSRIVDSVNVNENVLHIVFSLREYDDYTYTHCLNLAALGVLLGSSAGLEGEDLERLGMAGMLHDAGKCLLPKEIVNKPGPLSQQEMAQVKRHPQLGWAMLSKQGDIDGDVLRAVHEHHERVDGAGYPRGLTGEDIHIFSSIISIVDIFDALTSDRVYRSRVSPHTALRTLFNMRGQAFPEELVDVFIKRLGVYPAFSLVQLRNGCYAVVTRQTPGKPLFPEVVVFCDGERRPLARRRVDTWRLCGEMARKEFEIERCVEPSEMTAPRGIA